MAAAVWRAAAIPPGLLWRDWVLLLALFTIYTAFRRDSRLWPTVTGGIMAFLLGIYVQGQWIHLLAILGVSR